MIGLALSMASLLFFIAYFSNASGKKKRQIIYNSVRSGIICYQCKNDIETEEEYWRRSRAEIHLTLCTSCDRDNKLVSVMESSKKDKLIQKFYYLSYTNKISKAFLIINLISVFLNLGSIVYKPLGLYAGLFLFIGSCTFYINYRVTSRKYDKGTNHN